MPTIGENIRTRRKALGMSQNELAEAIDANRVTISKYETGGYLPSVPALERLAAALKTTPAQLSGNTDLWDSEQIDGDETEDEADRIRERLRRDPSFRILFSAAENVKPEHLEAAARMLQALGGNDD